MMDRIVPATHSHRMVTSGDTVSYEWAKNGARVERRGQRWDQRERSCVTAVKGGLKTTAKLGDWDARYRRGLEINWGILKHA